MFSERLKLLRSSKKMTQKDLAAILNITQQAIAKWENRISSPDYETLLRIADYFNVSVDYLLGRDAPPPADPTQAHPALPPDAVELLNLFDKLNADGRARLMEQAEMLVASGRYIKSDSVSRKMA